MGEAKRRKKLDPNYGKSPMMGWRTELEWKKRLGILEKYWAEARADLKVVETIDDVDESIDAVWIYKDAEDNEILKKTGRFLEKPRDKMSEIYEIIDFLNNTPDGKHVFEDERGRVEIAIKPIL